MREAFVLPETECERVTRTEMTALKMLVSFVSVANYGKEDLDKRLHIIPDGTNRYCNAVDELNECLRDLVGTVNIKQAKQLLNAAKDLEIRLVPKFTSEGVVVGLRREEYEQLVNCAREKCKFCTEDGESCVKCILYQHLMTHVPLENYGDGLSCPYFYTEWNDDET